MSSQNISNEISEEEYFKRVVKEKVEKRTQELWECIGFWGNINYNNPKIVKFLYRILNCCTEQTTGFEECFIIQKNDIDYDRILVPIHCTERVIDENGVASIIPWATNSSEIQLQSRNDKGMKILREGQTPLVDSSKFDMSRYYYHVEKYKGSVATNNTNRDWQSYFLNQECCYSTMRLGKSNLKGHVHVPLHLLRITSQPSSNVADQTVMNETFEADESLGLRIETNAGQIENVTSETYPTSNQDEYVVQTEQEEHSNDARVKGSSRIAEKEDPAQSASRQATSSPSEATPEQQDVTKSSAEAVADTKVNELMQLVNLDRIDINTKTSEDVPPEIGKDEDMEEKVPTEPSTSSNTPSKSALNRQRKAQRAKQEKAETKAAEKVEQELKKAEEKRMKIRTKVQNTIDTIFTELTSTNPETLDNRLPKWSERVNWCKSYEVKRMRDRSGREVNDRLTQLIVKVFSRTGSAAVVRAFFAFAVQILRKEDYQEKECKILRWIHQGSLPDPSFGPGVVKEGSEIFEEAQVFLMFSDTSLEAQRRLARNVIEKRIQYYSNNPQTIDDVNVADILKPLHNNVLVPDIVQYFIMTIMDLNVWPTLETREEEADTLTEMLTYLDQIFE